MAFLIYFLNAFFQLNWGGCSKSLESVECMIDSKYWEGIHFPCCVFLFLFLLLLLFVKWVFLLEILWMFLINVIWLILQVDIFTHIQFFLFFYLVTSPENILIKLYFFYFLYILYIYLWIDKLDCSINQSHK